MKFIKSIIILSFFIYLLLSKGQHPVSLLEKVGTREYESSLSQMGSQLWEGTHISLRGYIFPWIRRVEGSSVVKESKGMTG